MPERSGNSTPPTMEELVRRSTIKDDGCKPGLTQGDIVLNRPSATRTSTTRTTATHASATRSSTSSIEFDSPTRVDTGKSLVGGLARSMTRHIPDIKMHHSPMEKTSSKSKEQCGDAQEEIQSIQSGKETRKLSFQLPLGPKNPLEILAKPSPVTEEPPVFESFAKTSSQDASTKGSGLAARRHIKMDLTLPIRLPNSTDRNQQTYGIMCSLTPSRPRSPKTPYIRETESNRGRDTKSKSTKTSPIMEEDQAYVGTEDIISLADLGLESGQDYVLASAITPASTTPDFVRPPQRVRDRCYISRPTVKRKKSGGPSTSDSDFGSTPDGYWTPEVKEGMTEQELRKQDELLQLAKTSKAARSRRWPWNKSKASGSDEQMQDERSNSRRSMSVSIFKRSNRFPEILEKERKEKKPSKGMSSPWRREKPVNRPPLPSASLANMPVPPTFVPPGCERVPTPPMFDATGEVRGKLADFFFDSGFSSGKRKPKASPDGYWDSDAVLMSMQTDLGLTNDEDDKEGPEGRPPVTFHFGPIDDTPSNLASSGLVRGPDGYLTVRGFNPVATPPTPNSAQDSWFRMHLGDYTPNEESLTAAALKEADERRKFEWLVPEHLPNSPLCPLHVRYKGPSKGLCYWHGRKSNGWGVELGRDYVQRPARIGGGISSEWARGRMSNSREEKKRRLESLSYP